MNPTQVFIYQRTVRLQGLVRASKERRYDNEAIFRFNQTTRRDRPDDDKRTGGNGNFVVITTVYYFATEVGAEANARSAEARATENTTPD